MYREQRHTFSDSLILRQDHQALLKAKYCPWVAAASSTPKNTQNPC